jgi:serine/threonine protein kinase
MAPEEVNVSNGSGATLFKVTAKADVWAFGVFLWEIGTGRTRVPWDGLNELQVLHALQTGRTLPTGGGGGEDQALHPVVRALLARCWSRDPAQRYPHFRTSD